MTNNNIIKINLTERFYFYYHRLIPSFSFPVFSPELKMSGNIFKILDIYHSYHANEIAGVIKMNTVKTKLSETMEKILSFFRYSVYILMVYA
jgi:hypothetical protein